MKVKHCALISLFAVVWLLTLSPFAYAQWAEPPLTGSQQQTFADRTKLAGQTGLAPLLTAELVDKNANASLHRAVLRVQTDGVQIVDAASVGYAPKLDQAHIQYQLDDGQAVNSTALQMQFNNLSSGEHRIVVALVSNDGHSVGHQTTLKVHVP